MQGDGNLRICEMQRLQLNAEMERDVEEEESRADKD